jgi:hypothetical protein
LVSGSKRQPLGTCVAGRFRVEPSHSGGRAGRSGFRRISPVAARADEGPFIIRFVDLRHGVSRTATYLLASRLRASWMEARVTRVGRVSGRVSKSLVRRRLRPNHENVRSSTQRRGRTTLHVVAPLDDLHAQQPHLCHLSVNLPCVVAAIGPDEFESREAPSYLVEHQPGPVAILDRGVNDDPRRQPFAVDQEVDFAALHLLASVVPHLVVLTAPFAADLTDWLSRTAAEGGLRPPSARAGPCAARSRSPPRPLPAGTCERWCRPSSVAEPSRGR